MIIALTGHRPNKLLGEYSHQGKMSDAIRAKLKQIFTEYNPTQVISGMALGFDQIGATVALRMSIPVLAAIPFIGQESRWPQTSQDNYRLILAHKLITSVITHSGGYHARKMQGRNEWMVDRCNIVVACWNGSSGGTANCIKYAESLNREIIVINPNDLIQKI